MTPVRAKAVAGAKESSIASDAEPGFNRSDGTLSCDGVSLDAIAEAIGTPVYVYSVAAIQSQYSRLDAALNGVPHRLHYSVKANSNLAILGI
ncbi:MAG TPA: hypothetical protein VFC35_05170, partial [Gemmatimonadaceae bacterium]|nr:hypothetical protein [Gemmatimonadaceae bacterium]